MLKNKILLLISTVVLTITNTPQIINNGFITAYAATQKACLYFYDIDGEKIASLTQKLKYKDGHIYTNNEEEFKIPNPKDKTNVEKFNTDTITVNAIGWLDADTGKRYKAGDKFTFTEGDHHLYVRTDSPQITNEDSIVNNEEDLIHVVFHNRDGEEIEILQKDVPKGTEITIPDPNKYDDWDTSENKEGKSFDNYDGKGIYWYCETENKKYLFEKDKVIQLSKTDIYDFYIRTDKEVKIKFFYPFGTEDDDEENGDQTYFSSTSHNEGELYKTITAKVGDEIEVPKSFGAIIWNGTFNGWKYTTDEGEDIIIKKNQKFKLYSNNDLEIFAYYTYDENWDPNAPNENGDDNEEIKKSDTGQLANFNVESMANAGGSGFYVNVTTDANSRQKANIIGGKKRVNGDISINGIQGTINKNDNLNSSIIDPKGDRNDPKNYKLDKYGNKIEDSKYEDIGINEVLRQDDSAMYMDFYGNAFVYYKDISRENNIKIAQERLTAGKTASFAENIKDWDIQMVNRFEAIEYALLLGKYPSQGQVLVTGLDGNAEVTWDNSYMNKSTYNKLLNYRKTWNGWYDTYNDGLHEKYKSTNSSGNTVISFVSPELLKTVQNKSSITNNNKNLLDILLKPFVITAYAEEDEDENKIGIVHQTRGRILESFDLSNTLLSPIYFQLNKAGYGMDAYSSYGFTGLSELSSSETERLSKIYEALIKNDYTEEAASGICANIWNISKFNPEYNKDEAIGIMGWTDTDAVALKKFAGDDTKSSSNNKNDKSTKPNTTDTTEENKNESTSSKENESKSNKEKWKDLDIQIKFLLKQINDNISKLNIQTREYCGQDKTFKKLEDPEIAADMIYITLCAQPTDDTSASETEAPKVNGHRWEGLGEVRKMATKIHNARGTHFIGGQFANMSNHEIISTIFPNLPGAKIGNINQIYTESSMERQMIVYIDLPASIRATSGCSKLAVNKFVAEDAKAAMEDLAKTDLVVTQIGGFCWRTIANSSNMSFHSSGLAIDINWDVNPYMSSWTSNHSIPSEYQPFINKQCITLEHANAMKKHSYKWGMDFKSKPDIMHFSIGEVDQDKYHLQDIYYAALARSGISY